MKLHRIAGRRVIRNIEEHRPRQLNVHPLDRGGTGDVPPLRRRAARAGRDAARTRRSHCAVHRRRAGGTPGEEDFGAIASSNVVLAYRDFGARELQGRITGELRDFTGGDNVTLIVIAV